MSSPDGINWTSRSSAADNSWTSVTYGDGLFVAVSNDGVGNRVMTSPDGVNWTSRVSAADNSWMSVVYGDGLFVAVSSDGTGNRVMTSPDGINWTSRTSATDNMWYSVTHGNGLFVAVSYDGNGDRVMTSPDGIDWTLGISAADNYWYSVTYGNGLFVAISYDGTDKDVMTSPDGFEWTLQNNESGHSFISITYGNGLFAAAAYDASGNDIMTSPDGINWTIQRTDAANALSGIAYGNGLFVGITSGGPVMTSSYSPAAYAPSIDSVSIKLDSAMVHFNQTLPLMASAVTNYEYSIDNGSNWIARSPASASSPIALGGLNPRSTYPVKIRAINNAGASCETSAVQIRLCTQTTTSTTTVTSRGLFGWNGKDYTATGTYKDSLVNAAGCDSIATLNLTIIPAITNETVRIGNQTWTTNNLAISHYKNGDLIPQVTDRAVWDTLTTGAWCWYNNDSVNYAKYGKLYNWYAVNDPRGFGLPNFRMPTALDYDTLRQTTDKLTEFSQPGINVWNQDVRATNISGFGAYPLGLRNGEPGGSTDFNPNGESVDKWTSTVYPFSADSAIQVQLSFDSVADSLQYNALIASKRMGLPVRLLGCNPTTSTTTVTSRGLYGWNGVDYTATGTYQKVLVNATGCDSIATLNLTILPAITTDTVRIGTQTWTTKNLDVVRYRNGDLIPQVTDSASWRNLTTGAWAWYNNDSVNYAHYGRLYNWYAVNDSRGLAPRGYHVPTGNEALILQYNFPTDGNALIAPGINIWDEPTSPGTNISGFSMIPAGARYGTSGSGPTDFGELKKMGAFWLADDYERSSPAILFQYQANDTADAFVGTGALFGKMFGFPVRLIKDPCSPTSSDTTVSACFSFSWNGQTLTSSGIYKDTLTNIGGCDSIATLNLTITPKPTWYKDADADGYGVGDSLIVCDQPTGYRLLKDMIAATGDCDDTNANIRPNSSTAATSILASSTAVTAGGNVTLTVNGGSLGASDSWKWYSGSCGGTAIGSGTSIVVSPSVTTTYYLRAEGCTNTSCVSVTITACGPTGVTASAANNTICAGTSTTLTVQGVLSGAASWKWYKNACGSEDSRSSNEGPIGSGSTLKVSPTATTTYYVRSEGGVCGKTICKSITITVNPKPAKPASVSVPSKICKQSTIQLTVGEVKSATSYKWTVPAGWSIVSGQGTRTVRIKVGKASANVNVAAVNSCGTSANYAKMITVGNCTSTSSAVLVTTAMKPVADEMVDVAASLQIQAYPNPSTNQFTVRNNNSYVIQLRMVHITGQVVDAFSQVQPGASVQFGAAYRPGIYLVEATGNGLKTTQKLIKQ
jgi:uncharacterized protein (TIGR02145 family)